MAGQQHPPSTTPIPDSAYSHPTPDELASNQTYWDGYTAGMGVREATPSPAGSGSYDNYRTWVQPMLLVDNTAGFVNNEAVGFNNAVIQGANYLWTHDPQSPFFIPPTA